MEPLCKLISDLESKSIDTIITNCGMDRYIAKVSLQMFNYDVVFYGTGKSEKIALYCALEKLPKMVKQEIMKP